MIKVSIIIPMYNEERYIGRCLKSLKEQTFKDFEVILIDDGSKDNTIEIAESFKNDFPLTILKQKHGGPGKARNRGAKEAKGDIFVFVDADMYFDNNYIKYLIQPIFDGKEIGTNHGTEIIGNIDDIWAKTRSIDRNPTPKPERSKVLRAISKKGFFKSGGYNNDRYGFEDDLGSKLNTLFLNVDEAICYHNNPTNLREVFHHDARIGESLFAKKKYKEYLIKYKNILTLFAFLLLILIIFLIYFKIRFSIILISIFFLILVFLELLAIKKIKKDRAIIRKFKFNNSGKNEIIYLFSFPILVATRFFGYLYGFLKFIFFKK